MTDHSIIQPPPFGSQDQADTFIRNHELSSNEKFVIKKTRTHNPPDIKSLAKCNLRWEFNLASGVYCDGIPYIIIADQLRHCQYGPPKGNEGNNGDSDEDQEMASKKRKRKGKKINCPAKVWTKTIMKFPEYKVDVYEGGVRRCDRKRISQKLKREFDEDTQSFLMVFVQILNKHEHEALNQSSLIEDEPSGKATKESLEVNQGNKTPAKTPSKSTAGAKPESSKEKTTAKSSGKPDKKKFKGPDVKPKGPVLKKGASLKGKNLMKLALDFKAAEDLPFPLAQPKFNKKLDAMTDLELISLYHDLTGEMPNEMFAISNKEFSMPNMWLLLHLCIMSANAEIDTDLDFVVHPSIRVKGTEQIFTPVECDAIACASVGEHMHCPLCSSCEAYTNASLLKKHFSQKHVQNSIEFAGLKILRCLDGCDVEDPKNLKDGHWHCWKCKSCHIKQKSCFKHFMVHLKGMEENIQVHVLQNVNTCVKAGYITHEINCVTAFNSVAYEISSDQVDSSTDAAFNSSSYSPIKKYHSSPDTPSKRHHYVVSDGDAHGLIHNEQQNAVMYIQDENIASLLTLAQDGEVVIGYNDETDRDRLRCIIREMEQKCSSLEKTSMIQRSRIQFLTEKNEELEKSLSQLNMKYQDVLTQFEVLQKSDQSYTATEDDKTVSTSSSGTGEVKRFTVGKDGTITKDCSNPGPSKTPDSNDLVKQSLEGLLNHNEKQSKKGKTKKEKDSTKSEVKGLTDIRSHLYTIKKDIEQLKLAALLTNQQSYASQSPVVYMGNPSAQLIAANQQLLYTGICKSNAGSTSSPTVASLVKAKSVMSGQGKTATPSKSDTTKSVSSLVSSKSSVGRVSDAIKSEVKDNPHDAVSSDDKDDSKSGGKLILTKKNNTVIVALKAGSSSTLSKTEIEDLVNAAVVKMGSKLPQETNTEPKIEDEN